MVRRNKLGPSLVGRAETKLEGISDKAWSRAVRLTALLRPTLGQPLTQSHVERLARAANMSVPNLQRYRKRLAESELTTALVARSPGFPPHGNRLQDEPHAVTLQVIERLQRQDRRLRVIDVVAEIEQRCRELKIQPPHRRSIDRRIERFAPHLVERRGGNVERPSKEKPGHFTVRRPLDVVQIDHTNCDIMVVDDLYRQPIGRPVLSIAMDIATRCVLAFSVSFEAPSATTVAYLMTRVVASKAKWLADLGLESAWPMAGLPRSLHLDNATEFHSKALTRGCAEFGIQLIYRPPGRPHFGGHIERLIGTLMSRLKALPGATGSSVAQRKKRHPEQRAILTLRELETWLAIDMADRYHTSEHRGLPGATPLGAWKAQTTLAPPVKQLAAFNAAFLPAIGRTVRRGMIQFHHLHYWHAALAQFVGRDRKIVVHFDPADMSKLFFVMPDKTLLQIPYAQTHRPPVSLWEVLAANQYLRQTSKTMISEERLFKAIQSQRQIIEQASAKTKKARAALNSQNDRGRARAILNEVRNLPETQSKIDYSQPPEDLPVEVWPGYRKGRR